MRRDRIVKAVNNLKDALNAAQIRDLLRLARNGQQPTEGGAGRTQKILVAYNVFTQHYKEFSQDEKQLMSYFGLDPLVDVSFWSNLIEGEQTVSRKLLSEVDVGAYNVIFVMPKLRELLTQDNDQDTLFVPSGNGAGQEMRRLKIFIAERGQALSDPVTIVNVIRSMNELYDVAASVYGANGTGLAIGSIDSGGGKCFDFFGAVHVMESLDDLFVDIWNRVKHVSEEQMHQRIDMAVVGSAFASKVKDAQASKLISADQAQRMTKMAAKGVETLFRNGAYTENMDAVRHVRASEMLAPKTQLLEYKDDARAEPRRDDLKDQSRDNPRDALREPLRVILRDIGAEPAEPDSAYASLNGGFGGGDFGGIGNSHHASAAQSNSSLSNNALSNSAYGTSAYAPPPPPPTSAPEQVYRPQPSNLRDYRDLKESVKDLKDIFGGAKAL